jgi:hypothetical protein
MLLVLVCSAASASSDNLVDVEFCHLITHSKDYADQHVQFRAEVLFSYHGSALFDPKCGDQGGVGLLLPRRNEVGGDAKYLWRLMSGPPMRGVSALFRGTYRNNESQDPRRFLEDNVAYRELKLTYVSDIRVASEQ